jgi:uncharacterized metal-binding protein
MAKVGIEMSLCDQSFEERRCKSSFVAYINFTTIILLVVVVSLLLLLLFLLLLVVVGVKTFKRNILSTTITVLSLDLSAQALTLSFNIWATFGWMPHPQTV